MKNDKLLPVVVIIGSEYCGTRDFSDELFDRYGIDSLVVPDLTFAKMMVSHIDNAVQKLLFIHITMPKDDLAEKITGEYDIPYSDALEMADDACFREQIVDFDESTPEDLRILTFTGMSKEIGIDKFVDICADVINGNFEEDEDADEGSGLQDLLS